MMSRLWRPSDHPVINLSSSARWMCVHRQTRAAAGTFMQSESSLSAARLSSMTFSQSLRFLWQNARLVRSAAFQGQQPSISMLTA